MTKHHFIPVTIATAIALALAGCGKSGQAPTQMQGDSGPAPTHTQGDQAPDIGALKAIPSDLHMPSSYTVVHAQEFTQVQIASDETVEALAAEYDSAMAAAGWQGSFQKGRYEKGERSVNINANPDRQTHVTTLGLMADGPVAHGVDIAFDGRLPADVHLPASSRGTLYTRQTTNLMLHVDASQTAMATEYQQAMTAAGWTGAPMNSTPKPVPSLRFDKGTTDDTNRRSVYLVMYGSADRNGTQLRIDTESEVRNVSLAHAIQHLGEPTAVIIPMPKDLPADLHFPSAPYVAHDIRLLLEKRVNTMAQVDALVPEYERAMKDAGWEETLENRPDANHANMTFTKSDRELRLELRPAREEQATEVQWNGSCKYRPDDDCHTLESEMHLPSSGHGGVMREPFVTYYLTTDEPAEKLLAEYEAAMPALGWTKGGESKSTSGNLKEWSVGYSKDKDRAGFQLRVPGNGGATGVQISFYPVYFTDAPDRRSITPAVPPP